MLGKGFLALILCVGVLGGAFGVWHLDQARTPTAPPYMRIIVQEADGKIRTEDVHDGRIYFFLSQIGIVYMNTSIGEFWRLTDSRTLAPEHWDLVEKNMRELAEKWD